MTNEEAIGRIADALDIVLKAIERGMVEAQWARKQLKPVLDKFPLPEGKRVWNDLRVER